RLARLAVAEDDRHLAHGESRLQRPVGRLDLEDVSLGDDRVEVDRLQHLAAEALEAAGEVPLADAEDDAGVETAPAADHAAQQAPVADRAAGDVARADRQID